MVDAVPALTPAERRAVRPLVGVQGLPRRYVYTHASSAKISFNALARRRTTTAADEIASAHVVDYLRKDNVPARERGADLHKILTASWQGATSDHTAAMYRACWDDTIHFSRKGDTFVPHPPETVEQLLHQKIRKEERERELTIAAAFVKAVWEGHAVTPEEIATYEARRGKS